MTERLSDSFLDELFKCSLYKRTVMDSICVHLKFQYIPAELTGYKKLLKTMTRHYEAYKQLPTLGLLSQSHQIDEDVQEVIERIRDVKLPDETQILKGLEEYIKRVKFQLLYVKQAELYNSGKQSEAIDLAATESPEIANFSIVKDTNLFESVFADFHTRQMERESKMQSQQSKRLVSTGIDALDVLLRGGLDAEAGDTLCFLARSGTGKTKYLRWLGVSAARRGFKVLHVQGEGTKESTMDGYDSTWTGALKYDLYHGEVPEATLRRMEKARQAILAKSAEIEVMAYETFNAASMADVRDLVLTYHKIHGEYPDLLAIDYLELFDPGDGKRYSPSIEGEKLRKESSARKFRNLCNEFKMAGATASQANDVSPSDYNDPSWHMTRHNIAGAKGLVDSFSVFLTLNMTADEYENNIARIYTDKCRDVKGNHLIRFATNYARDRFYDRKRTIELYGKDLNKSVIVPGLNPDEKAKGRKGRK